jgi:hypothetical protein
MNQGQKVRVRFNMSTMTKDEAMVIVKNLKVLNDQIKCIT